MRKRWTARFAKPRDENEPAIVAALQRAVGGAIIERLEAPVDLMVYFRRRIHLLEVKMPGAPAKLSHADVARHGPFPGCDRRLRKAQARFVTRWPGKVHLVTNSQEALHAIGAKCENMTCKQCKENTT
jgi:hypothetical protein